MGNATEPSADGIEAFVKYVLPPAEGESLFTYLYGLPDGSRPDNIKSESRQVFVKNVRQERKPLSLKTNGFQLEKLTNIDGIDWSIEEQVSPILQTTNLVCTNSALFLHSSGPAQHRVACFILCLCFRSCCSSHTTCVTVQVISKFYPSVEELVQRVSGATRVHIFDHTVRFGSIA